MLMECRLGHVILLICNVKLFLESGYDILCCFFFLLQFDISLQDAQRNTLINVITDFYN